MPADLLVDVDVETPRRRLDVQPRPLPADVKSVRMLNVVSRVFARWRHNPEASEADMLNSMKMYGLMAELATAIAPMTAATRPDARWWSENE